MAPHSEWFDHTPSSRRASGTRMAYLLKQGVSDSSRPYRRDGPLICSTTRTPRGHAGIPALSLKSLESNPDASILVHKGELHYMTVAVNDWRGRNPQHNIDVMIHKPECQHVRDNWDDRYWFCAPSREEVENTVGRLAFTCQGCLRGQGCKLNRTSTHT